MCVCVCSAPIDDHRVKLPFSVLAFLFYYPLLQQLIAAASAAKDNIQFIAGHLINDYGFHAPKVGNSGSTSARAALLS